MSKRLLFIILVLLFVSAGAFAQVGGYSSTATDTTGKRLSLPTVKVCADALCATPITIYKDAAQTALSNPFTGDAQGNYSFYAAPGNYFVQVAKAGYGTLTTPANIGGDAAQTGNNVFTGSNTHSGKETFTSARFKGAPWYDIVAYGADPTGATDSAVATQAAIDACEAAVVGGVSAGTVYLPEGNFHWNTAITAKTCQIAGLYPNSSTRVFWDGTAGATVITKSGTTGNSFFSLKNIDFRPGTAIPGTWIDFTGSSTDVFSQLDHVSFHQTSSDAIKYANWINLHLEHMRFDGIGGYAIRLTPSSVQSLSSFRLCEFTYDNNPSTTATGFLLIDNTANANNLGTVEICGARIELNQPWIGHAAIVDIKKPAISPAARSVGLNIHDLTFTDGTSTNNSVALYHDSAAGSSEALQMDNVRESGFAATLGGTWSAGVNTAFLPATGFYSHYLQNSSGTLEQQVSSMTYRSLVGGTSGMVAVRIGTDANDRFNIDQNGRINLGGGTNATDVQCLRSAIGIFKCNQFDSTSGYQVGAVQVINNLLKITGTTFATSTNCSSSAAPAVCAAAASGSVVIAAAATTVVVNTTAVTANSQIQLTEDSSLGTKLSVTCNTTAGRTYAVTARTAGTSFTITTNSAPTTNPACLSYTVTN